MFCEQCGSKVEDGMKFCPDCGASVDYDSEPVNQIQQQASAPPPPMPSAPPPPPPPMNSVQPQPMNPVQQNIQELQQESQPKKKFPVALIIILMVLLAIVGGIVYAIKVVKEKVAEAISEVAVESVVGDLEEAVDDHSEADEAKTSEPESNDAVTDANKTDGPDEEKPYENSEDVRGGDEDNKKDSEKDSSGPAGNGFDDETDKPEISDDGNDNGNDNAGSAGIKSVDTKDPSKTAISGGKWDIMESGEFQYLKNGKAVTDTWAEDEGEYYYVGPDGCMVRNNYAPDGYWADDNGCWDKSVQRQELQFEPYNNDYVGNLWTFEITMDDAYKGTGKVYYSQYFGKGEPPKTDLRIERLGISSYAAYSEKNENEIYLLTVTDDGWGLIVSSDGQTEKCSVE
ncbi:MAG: zinc-ribbon domain-containing protein [Lachnospiraceae bacterium]|nr:zinc-ribbon domain-containing protein [Lachnospiraceae bacterium]